jgi:ketosteroid isomerase-like protein
MRGRFAAFALLLLAATCAACAGKEDLGHRWIEALNTHNPDNVIRLLAPLATWSGPTSPKLASLPHIRYALQNGWNVWKDRKYVAKRIVASGGSVIIEWHIQQTSLQGRAVPIDGATVLDVRDGHIVAVREYYDPYPYVRNYLQPAPNG